LFRDFQHPFKRGDEDFKIEKARSKVKTVIVDDRRRKWKSSGHRKKLLLSGETGTLGRVHETHNYDGGRAGRKQKVAATESDAIIQAIRGGLKLGASCL